MTVLSIVTIGVIVAVAAIEAIAFSLMKDERPALRRAQPE